MAKNLKQIIREAEKSGVAIGHFNVSELGALKAIAEVAAELKVPVIIGTSEGEREFIDPHDAVALVRDLREKHGQPVFLNADHTHSLDKAKEAVEAGYDAILFDGGKLPLEENIKQTKEVVKYVKSKNKSILVEGEIGDIGSGSTIRKELPEGAAIKPEDLTSPEEAARFVKETGVDLLAPAVGNIHGMFANAPEPALDIERIRAIKKAAKVPLVLHGGSGNTDEDFLAAIDAGVSIIHISTELRAAWRKGIEAGLKEKPDEVAPYKLMEPAIAEMKKILYNRLKLFNKL
jgi:fructose-bisphosphate aldolase class II